MRALLFGIPTLFASVMVYHYWGWALGLATLLGANVAYIALQFALTFATADTPLALRGMARVSELSITALVGMGLFNLALAVVFANMFAPALIVGGAGAICLTFAAYLLARLRITISIANTST